MKSSPPIAVVGMAGIFPGAADLDTFWANIQGKVDTTADVPRHRWIVDPDAMVDPTPRPDKAYARRCCLIRDFTFDPGGLDLPQDLTAALDPMHHLVLHAGREAFNDCVTDNLDRNRAGVILAAIALPTDSASRLTRCIRGSAFEAALLGDAATGSANPITAHEVQAAKVVGMPAALLARGLKLGGASYTLDAACASSLYAVKLACDELASGRADAMLAGGVSRPECLYTQAGFSQLRALSPSGRCAPFDETADGLVVGEGAGVVVLKRLADAVADGDTVHAVIRGIGLSNDIEGNLLAPASEGQLRAMRAAYRAAGWSPDDVDLVECHGAGTPVGDMTELTSLMGLWEEVSWQPGQCAIGSVKSMVGHLLTAAGMAGMIKTILAMRHRTLPPQINFQKPPAKSPLAHGPFRVQSEPVPWPEPMANRPRRAAVSAFGFGGINAHLLLEAWQPPETAIAVAASPPSSAPVAVVGMAAAFGAADSLRAFQEAVFNGRSMLSPPAGRFRGCDAVLQDILGGPGPEGAYLTGLPVAPGEFHTPPSEMPDILMQQMLMLKVAVTAMADAGLAGRQIRQHMGCIVGIDFDFETTDFHLRWDMPNHIDRWLGRIGLDLTETEKARWLESLRNSLGPPLTPVRTLGALGSVVASRLAREFRLGGPSYVVSADANSGLRALEIGIRALRSGELDTVLVGAVDMAGDVRRVLSTHLLTPLSAAGSVRAFDRTADGLLPGEGAAALVLKPLDRAKHDGDRIYAVIRGIGGAGGGDFRTAHPSPEAYGRSLRNACADADVAPDTIGYVECHGSGVPAQDDMEAEALKAFFPPRDESADEPAAIGTCKPVFGHTGAVAGLASVVKSALCLYHDIVPPLPGYGEPRSRAWEAGPFHLPRFAHHWLRDRINGPRRACTGAFTPDGDCMHVVLEASPDHDRPAAEPVARERKRPLGPMSAALFVVRGSDPGTLMENLHRLSTHLRQPGTAHQPLELTARDWFRAQGPADGKAAAVVLVGGDRSHVEQALDAARQAVAAGTPMRFNGRGGAAYTPDPLGVHGETAFVFPGSGNHYIGMGREIGLVWPEILRDMDRETERLRTQMVPRCYVPYRRTWPSGWESEALRRISADPLHMIFGQVVHGGVMARLMGRFDVAPAAVVGYSLGESAGLFAANAWPDRGEMLKRMRETDLFAVQLAGPCLSARSAWGIAPDAAFDWRVAVVNRPAEIAQAAIRRHPHTRLLIVNTPDQCVIGGHRPEIEAVIAELSCDAVFLEGVVTVHCDAALPVETAYRDLHRFPVTPPPGIRFYSCAGGAAYALTTENAADSIAAQAVGGFDFPAVIERAHADGVRLFVEMGPHASCTGMIRSILSEKPHLAVSACVRGENDCLTLLKCLGSLIAEGVPVNLDPLYGETAYPAPPQKALVETGRSPVVLTVGGPAPVPPRPLSDKSREREAGSEERRARNGEPATDNRPPTTDYGPPTTDYRPSSTDHRPRTTDNELPSTDNEPLTAEGGILAGLEAAATATAAAHRAFLDFSADLALGYETAIGLHTRLAPDTGEAAIFPAPPLPPQETDGKPGTGHAAPLPAFTRQQCMEFAVGSAARVLGPEFAEVDRYPVRVRLPGEPLMLVDRILSVSGDKGSLGPGRVVTEHDVFPDAWYLDGGRAPVCISVEAGQADLFLCAWLGIDHAVKGRRAYRLLDATVRFHRDLPEPGDTIRYEIAIDKFMRQGETYLFFFRFEGYIGTDHLITMRNGCAGFFTEQEVQNSGGIIFTEAETRPLPGRVPEGWRPPVPMEKEAFDDQAVAHLRQGDLAAAFGPAFAGKGISPALFLPGGRMHLIDRIVDLDPRGGRFGIGLVRAEADVHPDDWFLTCHFVDDMTMPGTLMYECCAHALRVFLLRMGWIADRPGVHFEPVIGMETLLKCRGPVTPETRRVVYQVEIKEIGTDPEPFVTADAHMFGDGRHIVYFENMSLRLSGVTHEQIENVWRHQKTGADAAPEGTGTFSDGDNRSAASPAVYDRNRILAFAVGNPSEAFGEPYRVFDRERKIARLPGPPYAFMDRVTRVDPAPWRLEPDGWVEAQYDVPAGAWYFTADRTGAMPFCVLLEIALQPCGWLAAYMGSALRSEKDLKFRNLGGKAVLHRPVPAADATLTMRTRLTKFSEAADMIIEHFDFQVLEGETMIYDGETYFGFFTETALANQVGLTGAQKTPYRPTAAEVKNGRTESLDRIAPLHPEDPAVPPAGGLTLPATSLLMIDRIALYVPDGGPHGLGLVQGTKTVDPAEWFFKAHFYQDPVCPGSLGIESFLQLVRYAAMDRWGHLADSHRFSLLTGQAHQWAYRGQVIPANRTVEVEVVITEVRDRPHPEIRACGYLKKDGMYIYRMDDFGFRLTPMA